MIVQILVKLINYLDTLPPLVILLLALNNKVLRGSFIFYYLLIQFTFNLSANILNELHLPNLYLYNLNGPLSFFALSLFYIDLLNTKKSKNTIIIASLLYIVFFFYDIFVLEGPSVFNSNTFCLASFILCAYALFYYLKIFRTITEDNILNSANFWFNTGIFSYYTINFFIFLTYNKLTQDKLPLIGIIWQLHNVIFLIMCTCLFIGTLCKPLEEK